MFECNVKKILARRVCKMFSGVKTFLVERFTAKRFLFRFLRSKNEKKRFFDKPRMTKSELSFRSSENE